MDTKVYRLALVGFGSVGRGLAQLLPDINRRLLDQHNAALTIVAVSTRRATVYNAQGLDPRALLEASDAGDLRTLPDVQPWVPLDMIDRVNADVLVEISATDLETAEPATTHIRAAFNRNLHVVTANKGPVALFGQELLGEARARNLGFGYEGTVMSGTPALRLGLNDLTGCDVQEVRGIVNGTTNYILTQMESGMAYDEALAEAQRLGYAEADPTGDVEGFDAAGKAVILANMLFDAGFAMRDVEREGITALTPDDIQAAAAAGERWKLIARVAREEGRVVASVRPTRLPVSHPLAGAAGATNALTYTTDLLGEVTLVGPGAGGVATAFALISDILALPRS